MSLEVIIAGANVLAALVMLVLALMRNWPKVVVAAPVPRNPCGFFPTV